MPGPESRHPAISSRCRAFLYDLIEPLDFTALAPWRDTAHEAPQGSAHRKDSMCQEINIKCRFKCCDYHPNHLGATEHQKAEEQNINWDVANETAD